MIANVAELCRRERAGVMKEIEGVKADPRKEVEPRVGIQGLQS